MENATTIHQLWNIQKPIATEMLFQANEGKAIALKILENETLKEHITKIPALLVCISGEAKYVEENRTLLLAPGSLVKIPENVLHRIEALAASTFLLIK